MRSSRGLCVLAAACLVAMSQACSVLTDLDGLTSNDAGAPASTPTSSGGGGAGGAVPAPSGIPSDDAGAVQTAPADDGAVTSDDGGGLDQTSAPADDAGGDTGAAPDSSDSSVTRPPTIAHVQNVTQVGSGTSLTGTFAYAVHAGDLLVGVFRGSGTVVVEDSLNGSWTQINTLGNVYLFYVQNSAAAPAGSLVIALAASTSGSVRMSVDEFSGVAPSLALDAQSTGTSATGSTTWSAGSTPSIAAGELVYAGAGTSGNSETFAAGATNGVAMTIGGQFTTGNDGTIVSEYALSSALGAQDAFATLSVSDTAVNGGQATFRP